MFSSKSNKNKHTKGKKPAEFEVNPDIPLCFLDGLVDGEITGWAQGAQDVRLSINNESVATLPCQRYRADLAAHLSDPNASFCYPLTASVIKSHWRHLESLTFVAEFLRGEEVVGVAQCQLAMDQLANTLGFERKDKLAFSVDGIQEDGSFTGWCDGANQVDLYLEDQHIACIEASVEREDLTELVGNIQCGFSYQLDALQVKPHWFNQAEIKYQVMFRSPGSSEPCASSTLMLSSADVLASIRQLSQHSLDFFAPIIENSHLWDAGYYLSQVPTSEVAHENVTFDYLIKGERLGRTPNPYFNTNYYVATNPDVAHSGLNAFFHYLTIGEKEDRQPTPYFSPKIYREANPDLANWEVSLLAHFVIAGLKEGRKHSEFSTGPVQDNQADPYQAWRLANEQERFIDIARDLNEFTHQPLISIVVPVYNPEKELLAECIESVMAQSYPNWQLCLADDCSPKAHVREVLEYYAQRDSRINVVFREQNGHISAASNSALDVAIGEWTALLDHDDELHQHALYHVVKAINETPDVALIYSDEDKMTEEGERFGPHFKSDWNLDLLYSQNYVSHLGVYKTEIVKQIGGFRLGYEGSQDYDLLLRYSREIDHAKIVHIPKVLYHWRVVEGSTASGSEAKSYTTEAGIKALEDHFKQLGKAVTVERGKHDNIYRVEWSITDNPFVSLIIPTYNGHEITKQAIDSIVEKSTYRNFEIILVDNNSNDPDSLAYFDEVNEHEQVTVLKYPYPFNYSAINNFAAQRAKGEILGLVNNDIEVINPEWLTEMVSHAQREDVGCVGAMLYYPNDTIQHAGVVIGIGGVAGHSHKHYQRDDYGYFSRLKVVQNYSAVTAACLLVRKSVFDEVGGLNEEHLTVAFNDVDFCLKVQKAGYRNLWTPYAELYHHESISRGSDDHPEKIKRFHKEVDYMKAKWATHKQPDPCYSVNLSIVHEDFSIAE